MAKSRKGAMTILSRIIYGGRHASGCGGMARSRKGAMTSSVGSIEGYLSGKLNSSHFHHTMKCSQGV
jgi:hypothetical protein